MTRDVPQQLRRHLERPLPTPTCSGSVAVTGADASELSAELELLARRLPVPQPSWHGYVPEIRAMAASLLAAAAAIRTLPDAADELVRQIEGSADFPDDDAGGPALRAARKRLHALPLPAGEHPFLDEIVPTYEAAEAALAAHACVKGGEAAFVRAGRQALPPAEEPFS